MSIVVLPADVARIQAQIKADLAAVTTSLQRCATAGTFTPDKTPSDWTSWQSMKERANAFIAESPSFLSSASQYEAGEAIQKELAGWHDRARALGCDAGPAPTLPPDTGLFSLASLGSSAFILLLIVLLMKSK